ncbi:ribosome maturation factor RimP [uncultured Desulfosarcina sp.]|uniref:ribosome maturation factor RimP n=1 Tax=uncultured Desulfosarcina sp. TaxID=218289 RepID=UPI0029C60593|nr:ribosome maturation factor RimP [uncultured Desulfosarcina sp.]
MAKRGRKQKSKHQEKKTTHFLLDDEARKRRQAVVDSVVRLAEPLCQSEGLELVHVEYQREPGGVTLRIYLDKTGGVTLDDCVDVSRQLEDLLDVHASDLPPYRLEVTSPGVDRPVGKLEDYRRFTGQRARIRLAEPVDGRKNFTGVLDGVSEEKIRLKMDDGIVHLDFSDILRARLINFNGEH